MAPNDEESRKALATLIATATTLLEQLQSTLTTIQRNPLTSSPTPSTETTSINALSLARDTSLLIRAHSTKISLLIINEPFTPSAISTVIRELIKGPIPGLATAAQACTPDLYTSVVRKELAYRCQKVLVELWGLLKRVPDDGKVLPAVGRDGSKGSLVLTGKLWSACDEVVKLADLGVGGFYVRRAEEWRDTLKDVMEELKEWGEEEDGEDEDDLADQMNNASLTEQEMVDDLMNSSSAIPKSDPDKIRPRLDSTLKRLRMIVLLYQAISKRRFKKLPKDTTKGDMPSKLDKAASVLETLPDTFGDLAGAFYELDAEEIDRLMEECFESAVGVSEVLKLGWEGESDEFSEWMEKFKVEVKKT
ncbi:uncharacterized protein BKA55DRAFT_559236 [Fusarium redolens]|uniref:Cyclin-D1-binding protein 1-like N-terminal domain-containing protein n=1 Tax=Fusarium redolens TaxID=48865 RepID=A0A9P9HZN5_FUSRE|nr:uncharacterized protein BKA55DRAFT_559236 [Fusarium redolens]KAH7265584.1 hypothetical protein BKA55DRAFT_559236 [Fusarium redolens]